jgi:uncharacterized protein (DUF58 family)
MKRILLTRQHRLRRADRFPLVLDRRRITLVPTRYGALFCMALAGMLLGAANHNNNFAFLMTFLLAGVGIVALFSGRRNLSGLEVLSVAGTPVYAGDPAPFTVSIRSPDGSRRALSAAVGRQRQHRFSLVGGTTVSIDLSVQTERRGSVSPTPLRISTTYPLGLFRARATVLPEASSVPVFPKPAGISFPPPAGNGTDGGSGSAGGAGSEDFDGLRPYQPGDPPGHIAWKAVARERGLAVKHFSGSAGGAVYLQWDRIRAGDKEEKLSILCKMVLEADRAGLVYGLRLPGRTLRPATGTTHRLACLTALALFGESPDHAP